MLMIQTTLTESQFTELNSNLKCIGCCLTEDSVLVYQKTTTLNELQACFVASRIKDLVIKFQTPDV